MNNYFKRLYDKGQQAFYDLIETKLKKGDKIFVVTANPETFIYGEKDNEFNTLLLDKNTTLIPDGIGIVKASQILNYNIKERITGIDLAVKLLEICNEEKYSLALLGASEEVLKKMVNVIGEKYPHIRLIKAENGYIEDKDRFFQEIAKSQPDVCLVALGIPAQEKLIYKHIKNMKKGIFVGVGGSFDVISGTKKRAPKIFQKMNIEWLYRIIKEPKRIKRFYNNNIKFILKIKKYK